MTDKFRSIWWRSNLTNIKIIWLFINSTLEFCKCINWSKRVASKETIQMFRNSELKIIKYSVYLNKVSKKSIKSFKEQNLNFLRRHLLFFEGKEQDDKNVYKMKNVIIKIKEKWWRLVIIWTKFVELNFIILNCRVGLY